MKLGHALPLGNFSKRRGLGLELPLLAAFGLGFGPLPSSAFDSGLELGLGTPLLFDPTPGLGLELPLLAAFGLGFGPLPSSAFGAKPEQAATHASIPIDPLEPTNMLSLGHLLGFTQCVPHNS